MKTRKETRVGWKPWEEDQCSLVSTNIECVAARIFPGRILLCEIIAETGERERHTVRMRFLNSTTCNSLYDEDIVNLMKKLSPWISLNHLEVVNPLNHHGFITLEFVLPKRTGFCEAVVKMVSYIGHHLGIQDNRWFYRRINIEQKTFVYYLRAWMEYPKYLVSINPPCLR